MPGLHKSVSGYRRENCARLQYLYTAMVTRKCFRAAPTRDRSKPEARAAAMRTTFSFQLTTRTPRPTGSAKATHHVIFRLG